jgi:hypothetical protein
MRRSGFLKRQGVFQVCLDCRGPAAFRRQKAEDSQFPASSPPVHLHEWRWNGAANMTVICPLEDGGQSVTGASRRGERLSPAKRAKGYVSLLPSGEKVLKAAILFPLFLSEEMRPKAATFLPFSHRGKVPKANRAVGQVAQALVVMEPPASPFNRWPTSAPAATLSRAVASKRPVRQADTPATAIRLPFGAPGRRWVQRIAGKGRACQRMEKSAIGAVPGVGIRQVSF